MANSDSFSTAVSGTKRGNFATVAGITSASTSSGVFQVVTDSGTNLPFIVAVPTQGQVLGTNPPIDFNANASVLNGNLGRPGSDYRGSRPYFSSSSFDGHPFTLQCQGRFTVATATTSVAPTVTVYQTTAAAAATALAAGISGNATLVGAGNSIGTAVGTTASTAGSYGFLFQATLFWDSTVQLLSGESVGLVTGPAGTVYTQRAIITGISVTAYTNLNFFASLQFTGASSVVGVTPTEFTLSAI